MSGIMRVKLSILEMIKRAVPWLTGDKKISGKFEWDKQQEKWKWKWQKYKLHWDEVVR